MDYKHEGNTPGYSGKAKLYTAGLIIAGVLLVLNILIVLVLSVAQFATL